MNSITVRVKTAPAIFQQIVDTMIFNLKGVTVYLDDIIVVDSIIPKLMSLLDIVLTKIPQARFQLQKGSCEFLFESPRYLGYIFDKDGCQSDPDNINAIKIMPRPTNVTTLSLI